jgi:hypothetical protein
MKVSMDMDMPLPAQSIWERLLDFDRYSEWNPLFPLLSGTAQPEAELQGVLTAPGLKRREFKAKVTGLKQARYLSFEILHPWGEWWRHEEFIFRMKEESDRVDFTAEVYITGLAIRFGRGKVEAALRNTLWRVCDLLKVQAFPPTPETSAPPKP